MAVEHNMADLNITWWDLLQRIAFNLDWSYAALWTVTADRGKLVWKQGYCNTRSNDDANSELFHSLYSSCTFTPGEGFAGHALAHKTNSILWLSGDGLNSLEHPVEIQTRFLQAARIQTVVCLPLGLTASSYVLELGTVDMIREAEDLAQNIKAILLHLLSDGLPHLMDENPVGGGARQQLDADLLFRGQLMQPVQHDNAARMAPVTMAPVTMPPESVFEAAGHFSQATFAGGTLPRAPQRQLGVNVYSELFQSIEQEDTFARQVVSGGGLSVVPPQMSWEVAELSVEPSPGESLTSPWDTEQSMARLELNSLNSLSWTTIAEATSNLGLRELAGTNSVSSSRLAEEIVGKNDEMSPIVPFSSTLEQFMAAADQEQQRRLLGAPGGTSLTRSISGGSSRSSLSLRSQNVEDNEISSAILESYADCHISELDNVPHSGASAGGSSSTTMARDPPSTWRGGTPRSSPSSSKETSPESKLIPPRRSYGIHPRVQRVGSQHQRMRSLERQHSSMILEQSPQQLERQHSGVILEQSPQHLDRQHSSRILDQGSREHSSSQVEDLKPGPGAASDSTPRLVQFGNVLQLGNAAGQVTEAPPQEHDEAAVSHMLAERRRRNKQNENFSQLKCLIPSAVKMDKASVLAATITYITELKERLRDLEQSNQRLKSQLLSVEQDQSSAVGAHPGAKAKGSPGRSSVRTPNSLSPTEEDLLHVSVDGNGNLTIDIRSPCTQPDTAMHIFACLKEKHFKVITFNVGVYDNRIHANIIVKMKRKNSAGQSAVCAEVEQALTACLNNFA